MTDRERYNAAMALGRPVAYAGAVFVPPITAYRDISQKSDFLPRADVGASSGTGPLTPLIFGALWEIGFVREYGLLSTWQN